MGQFIAEREDIRVVMDDDTREGFDGEYDPNDKDDKPLMRFYIMHETNDGWVDFDDGSYCTQIDARLDKAELQGLTELILREVYEAAKSGYVKKVGERLSWIDRTWLKEGVGPDRAGVF